MIFSWDFRHLILISMIGGNYIPGTKPLILFGIKIPAFFLYCIFTNLLNLFIFGEQLYALIYIEMPPIFSVFLTFCASFYLWGWIRRCFILLSARKMEKLILYWSEFLDPPLWPEIRERELKAIRLKTNRFILNLSIFLQFPLVIATVIKIIWTRKLFMPSSLAFDILSYDAPLFAIVLQGLNVILSGISWIAFEAFTSLLLNLIQAEFTFLSKSLTKIVTVLRVDENGRFYGNINDTTWELLENVKDLAKISSMMRQQLSQWVRYHGKVIIYMRMFEKTFSPILAAQFMFVVITMCGLLFCTATYFVIANFRIPNLSMWVMWDTPLPHQGQIPMENVFYCYICICTQMSLQLLLCRCGDAITGLSSGLGAEGLSSAWPGFHKDIVHVLSIISVISQRRTLISPTARMPITSKSFRKLITLQYRFYRFMADMH